MSYCRWSSDDWKCDLYCYEDDSGGWTTHVARQRVVGDVPPSGDILKLTAEQFLEVHNKQMTFLETAERKDIGLLHDGETFNDATLEDFLERVRELRRIGYNVPKYVDETILEEIREAT